VRGREGGRKALNINPQKKKTSSSSSTHINNFKSQIPHLHMSLIRILKKKKIHHVKKNKKTKRKKNMRDVQYI